MYRVLDFFPYYKSRPLIFLLELSHPQRNWNLRIRSHREDDGRKLCIQTNCYIKPPPMSSQSLLVCGPNSLVRASFPSALSSCSLLGELRFVDSWSALRAELSLSPSQLCIAVPIHLGMETLQQFQQIKRLFPKLRLLIYHPKPTLGEVQAWLKSGAFGLLDASTTDRELCEAVRQLIAGQQFISAGIRARLTGAIFYRQADEEQQLSKRELQVLELIVQEHTTQEIAAALYISKNTAETHRINIIRKLGVRNTAGLVREALMNGLCDFELA